VTGTETKLVCIKQASFFNVPLNYFQNKFSNNLPVVDNRLIGRKFLGNFGSLPGFGNGIILLPSKAFENGIAEVSNKVNVSDVLVVFLEDA
jgi:hypothetical protein